MEYALDEIKFGQMNALVKILGGKEGVERFLRGDLIAVEAKKRELAPRTGPTLKSQLRLHGKAVELAEIKRFSVHSDFQYWCLRELRFRQYSDFPTNYQRVPPVTVRRRLFYQGASLNRAQILCVLGGRARAGMHIAQVHQFLSQVARHTWEAMSESDGQFLFFVRYRGENVRPVIATTYILPGTWELDDCFLRDHPNHEFGSEAIVVSPV